MVGTQALTATVTGTTWSVAVPIALGDGTYDVKATAIDNALNVGTDTTTGELIVDTSKPMVTVNMLPPTNNNKPTLTGTVSDASPAAGLPA